jgi:chorismate-pyruvate lyase
MAQNHTSQAVEIASLKREVRRLASQVDALTSILKRKEF